MISCMICLDLPITSDMTSRTLLTILLIAVIGYLLYLRVQRESVELVGVPAPSFSLPSKGGMIGLDEYRGKVVLLNFWASWCPPCVSEMPSLERLHRQMQGKDFQILAVSEDEGGWAPIDRFLKRLPVTMTILLDGRGDAAALYGTNELPETYLIDKKGVIIKKYRGPRNWMDEKIVSEILGYVQGAEVPVSPDGGRQ